MTTGIRPFEATVGAAAAAAVVRVEVEDHADGDLDMETRMGIEVGNGHVVQP